MKKLFLFFAFCLFLTQFANAQLKGVYTVGTGIGSDFETPIRAVKALYGNGVSAPVTFQIEDGTYSGQLLFSGRIKGSSPSNPITFISKSRDSAGVVFKRDTHLTVWLQECPNIVFKQVSFSNYNEKALNVYVQNSDSCRFINCNFNAGEVTNNRGLQVASSRHVLVEKCRFQSSFTGLYSAYTDSLKVAGCHFKNLDRNGIELIRCNNPIISNNLLDSFITVGDADPIDLDVCNGGLIDGNQMYSGEYGIVITESNKSWKFKNDIVVQNNEFSNLLGALRVNDVSRLSFFHNSIYHFERNSYAIDISETDSLKFANNNIVLHNVFEGFTIDLVNDSASLLLFDYNNIYFNNVKNPSVFLTKEIVSFDDLKNAYSGFNKRSVSVDPYFIGQFDLRTKSPLLNNAGLDVDVNADILGNVRPHPMDNDSVDIGCYEFSITSKDLDFSEIVEPNVLAVGSNSVTVGFVNFGSQNILDKQLEIEYSIDNGNSWVFDTLKIDTLTKGGKLQFTFTKPWVVNAKGSYLLKVRIAKGLANEVDAVDEIEKEYCTGVSGQFTIGSSSSADFSNFSEAIASLKCGVTGPVTFNVESGTYNETIRLNEVPGMNSVNTVSFEGASKGSTIITSNWFRTLDFNGASHFVFSKLTIENTNAVNPIAIFLFNGSSYNAIVNCLVSTLNSGRGISEWGDVVYRGVQNKSGYNTYLSNTIESTLAFSMLYTVGAKIIGNQCNAGLHFNNAELIEIADNQIVALDADAYAIDGYLVKGVDIRRNFLRSGRGVHLSSDTAFVLGDMVNNVIISTSQISDGITFRDVNGLNFLHNSISSHGKGCLTLSQSKKSVFKNNILCHFNTSGEVVSWQEGDNVFDNNNVFTKGNTLFYYNIKYYNSLSDLKKIPGFGKHENIRLNPAWVDSFMNLNLSTKSPIMEGDDVGVLLDYNGKRRCIGSPTMGAFENIVPGTPIAYFSISDTVYFSSTEENIINLKSEFGNGLVFEDTWYNEDWKLLGTGTNYRLELNKVGIQTISLVKGNCQKADTFTKTILVIDTIRPSIKGAKQLYAKQCAPFNPFNKISIFDHDTYKIDSLGTWPSNTKKVGSFTYQIVVTDSSGNSASFTTNIIVSDSVPPTIDLVGKVIDTISYWSDFNDEVKVWDQCNDVNTIEIQSESDLDSSKSSGLFYKTYWAVDHVGNQSNKITRYVIKEYISVNSLNRPSIKIYPNPSKGFVNVTTDIFANETLEISVVGLTGKELVNYVRIASVDMEIDISTLPMGTYILQLKSQDKIVSKRIVKIK